MVTHQNAINQLNFIQRKLREMEQSADGDRKGSGLGPNAQKHTRCEPGTQAEMLANRAWAIVNGQGDAPTVVRAVIEVMMLNACRISEVLKISGHNITDTGQIYVKGSKKSHNRLLLVAVHRDFWMLRKNFTEKLGDIYTRYFFYHRFKALGLQSSLTGNSKNAVTHVFRHMVIENLKGIEVETRDTQRYVGHKSRTTTEGYETKELL